MQEFYCKTKILSGENALGWLDSQTCESLLVVTDPYFRENGWADRIANRVCAERRTIFDGVKPDPTVVRGILEQLGADSAATLYVGDSAIDMKTAKNAGLTACGVTWGFRSREELAAEEPAHIVDSAAQLRALILGE